jgi:hypothetical protein
LVLLYIPADQLLVEAEQPGAPPAISPTSRWETRGLLYSRHAFMLKYGPQGKDPALGRQVGMLDSRAWRRGSGLYRFLGMWRFLGGIVSEVVGRDKLNRV